MHKRKRNAIIRFVIICTVIAIGLVAALVPFNVPGTNYRYKSFAGGIKLGIDLKGGVYAVYEAEQGALSSEEFSNGLDGTVTRLSTLLTKEGYMEATVAREGSDRIRVEVPDVKNPEDLFAILGEPADLEFTLEGDDPAKRVTGKNVENAYVVADEGGQPAVQIILDSEGAARFGEITSNNIGKVMSIVINGEIFSQATIQAAITNGKPTITGRFTYEEAKELANQILSGAFDVRLSLIESSVVSATLGENALITSLIAGIVGIVGIIIFMVCLYRIMGVMASVALLLFTVLYLFILWAFPWVQLTLPGIAGIILSIGMAVDANVIIFERIKYEYKLGKSINASVNSGTKKAFSAILDANITTVIAAVVLIILGSGTIKAFGITWLIGILLSFFNSVVFSRYLLKNFLLINDKNPKLYNLKRDDEIVEIDDNSNSDSSNEKPRGIFGLAKKIKNNVSSKKAKSGSVANE